MFLGTLYEDIVRERVFIVRDSLINDFRGVFGMISPEDFADALIEKMSSLLTTHNTSNDAHESLFKSKVDKVTGKGLSSEDFTTALKTKLEELTNITIDSNLNSFSTNPVQNKIVKSEIDKKADSHHTHTIYDVENLSSNINSKVDCVSGKGLSTNDYTTDEKNKLKGIDTGANKTIIDNVLSDNSSNPVQNKVINNALNNKLNSVEVQGNIIKFTNKDRILLDNLQYMLSHSSNITFDNTYYYFDEFRVTDGTNTSSNNKIGTTNDASLTLSACIKNGAGTVQTGTVNFKLVDGTVLGTGTKNGNYYTLNSGVFDVGIYYVYAEATINGQIIKSNIVTMFVKEQSNILSYNQYSGGEYNNDLADFPNTMDTINISNEWSSIGECSVKCTSNGGQTIVFLTDNNKTYSGKTVTCKATIYSVDVTAHLTIYSLVNGAYTSQSVQIPVGTVCDAELTTTLPSNSTKNIFRIDIHTGNKGTLYADNISLSLD